MTVPIALDALIDAFEDASPALNYYVDRASGEVILVSETLGFIEAGRQRAEMAEEPGRYEPVPVSGFGELTDDLEAFIDTRADEAAGIALEAVLEATEPSVPLARYLENHDETASAWRDFRRERFRARAERWLIDRELSPIRRQ